jgi:hypothetical protein
MEHSRRSGRKGTQYDWIPSRSASGHHDRRPVICDKLSSDAHIMRDCQTTVKVWSLLDTAHLNAHAMLCLHDIPENRC